MGAFYFHTMIIDEAHQLVRIGPSADGGWIEIDGWGDNELRVLAAIARRGVSDLDLFRRASGPAYIDRRVVCRIRKRFRKDGVSSEYAKAVIRTKKGSWSQTYVLNPSIEVQIISGPLLGSRHPGEHRAIDLSLHGIRRAIMECFGEPGYKKVVSLLPEEVRQLTVGLQCSPGRWVPMRYVLEWLKAAYEGPAQFDFEVYGQFLKVMVGYKISHIFVDSIRSLRLKRFRDVQNLWRRAYDSGDLERRSL